MDEDLELNALAKNALEARAPFRCDVAGLARRQAAGAASDRVRRRRLSWAAGALLAASLALVASFRLPSRADSPSVEDALLLLSEAEGVEWALGESGSTADLLVAWQEAPI